MRGTVHEEISVDGRTNDELRQCWITTKVPFRSKQQLLRTDLAYDVPHLQIALRDFWNFLSASFSEVSLIVFCHHFHLRWIVICGNHQSGSGKLAT